MKKARTSNADPFAVRSGNDAFEFAADDNVYQAKDPFAPKPAEEPLPELTLEGVEQEFENIIEQDAANAHQETIDAKKRYALVDADRMETNFHFTVVFQNAEQRREFCEKSGGLVGADDYYVDGMALAERLGIKLTTPYVTDAKLRKAWQRILGLAVKPGKGERY